ncbi:MGDG synthase family glycosyltransferase [Bacillus sp. JJ1764]|uniref:MGDG synthase family glycosyltransferase n=1 Tax=Bacillus sp. JJ1764 TaxID=3122964 RepID=UPI002FFFA1DB
MKALNREKVLILTGNYGDGHVQVAKALHEAIQLQYSNLESVIFDFMEWVHPYSNQVSRFLYLQGVKTFPQLYGFLFQKTRRANTLSTIMKSIFSSGLGRMLKLMKEVQPSVVVSTFPLAAAVMSKLKTYGFIDIPTVTIITDHTDHSCWIYPNTDQYIVGSTIVKDSLIQLGVEEHRIAHTGIPIRQQFSQAFHQEELYKKHGIDPHLPTVLIMGGGCGMIGDGISNIQEFEQLSRPIQIMVVCGHNEKLRTQMLEKTKGSQHHFYIMGYIDYVHELMAISDLMITKPGGVTTFEAIAMELPMILYKPIPGQEQDNAKFLVGSGVAVQAETHNDLIKELSYLLCHPEQIQLMKENSKRFHPKESAFASSEIVIHAKDHYQNKQKLSLYMIGS